MRSILFGAYDSWSTWGLTLTGQTLSAPSYKSSFVAVPGRDGDLDLSTALTDGEPRYTNRNFEATFEISSGNRTSRETLLSTIVNALDGRQMNITLPDDLLHYLTGRLQVAISYNDEAHGALTVKANCGPWRQATTQRVTTLTASSSAQTTTLTNGGRRILIPTVVVSGTGASVTLTYGSSSCSLNAGTYTLPDLQLQPGNTSLSYSGTGTITITYREAVL